MVFPNLRPGPPPPPLPLSFYSAPWTPARCFLQQQTLQTWTKGEASAQLPAGSGGSGDVAGRGRRPPLQPGPGARRPWDVAAGPQGPRNSPSPWMQGPGPAAALGRARQSSRAGLGPRLSRVGSLLRAHTRGWPRGSQVPTEAGSLDDQQPLPGLAPGSTSPRPAHLEAGPEVPQEERARKGPPGKTGRGQAYAAASTVGAKAPRESWPARTPGGPARWGRATLLSWPPPKPW